MDKYILLYWPEYSASAGAIAKKAGLSHSPLGIHHFPDGESLVRINVDVNNKHVLLFGSMNPPGEKLTEFVLAARTCRELGALKVTLIAPYLGYLRQDTRFRSGESVSARIIAGLLSAYLDAIITVDPHLHRIKDLSEIYTCESVVLHADKLISEWIVKNIKNPVLVGPDEESEQWVRSIAKHRKISYIVLKKQRLSDVEVKIDPISIAFPENASPVLVDDMISTGTTLITCARAILKEQGIKPTVLAIHGLFSGNTYATMINEPIASIHTCNTVIHPSNTIKVDSLVAEFLVEYKNRR